jgi:hypothetical protein
VKIVPVFLRYDYGIKSRGDSYPAGVGTQFITKKIKKAKILLSDVYILGLVM